MKRHPKLTELRGRAVHRAFADAAFREGIITAMDVRVRVPRPGRPEYGVADVAEAAGVSRARVYQILDEEKGRVS